MARNIIIERIGEHLFVRGDTSQPMTPEDELWNAAAMHEALMRAAMPAIYAKPCPPDPKPESED